MSPLVIARTGRSVSGQHRRYGSRVRACRRALATGVVISADSARPPSSGSAIALKAAGTSRMPAPHPMVEAPGGNGEAVHDLSVVLGFRLVAHAAGW